MGDAQIWIDGALVAADAASLSANDHGITVGNGVFESMKVVGAGGDRVAFALTRHLVRLHRSAAAMGLVVPCPDDEVRAAIAAVVDANPGAGRVRLTVTGGSGPPGADLRGHAGSLIIAATPLTPWPPTTRVATVPWRRNEHSPIAGVKTTSYAENVIALQYAHDHDAAEAIFANTAGHLCEGAGSNVFVAVDGRLVTPPLSSGCLAGVTRELLLELIDVTEEDLPLEALAAADEAFVTSSTRDVHPVERVDDVALPRCPGPLTAAAAAAFADLVATSPDP